MNLGSCERVDGRSLSVGTHFALKVAVPQRGILLNESKAYRPLT